MMLFAGSALVQGDFEVEDRHEDRIDMVENTEYDAIEIGGGNLDERYSLCIAITGFSLYIHLIEKKLKE